jgi:uracil-DNA glycosylase
MTFPAGVPPTSSNPGLQRKLARHVQRLRACQKCPGMGKPVVSGGAVLSEVLLVGQAPGDKEPVMGRPFAWTAGKTLFQWFEGSFDLNEARFRSSIYMAAVCRCFPGKKETGGDRVPDRDEIENCSEWLEAELELLKPRLVIPVGKLAIEQFLAMSRMDRVVGKQFAVKAGGISFDLIPLPHPSGASPWHRMEPGKSLLRGALSLIGRHPSFLKLHRG